MANWSKQYTKTPVDVTKLTMEIEDDGLTPNLVGISDDNSGSDNLTVTFDAEVTGGELTTLDATVAAHDGSEATYYTIFCYDCGCTQGKRALSALTACPVCSGTDIQSAYHNDNLDATTDPGINDDDTQGYCEGSHWINVSTNKAFICLDNATGAAVWAETTVQSDPNAIQKDGSVAFIGDQSLGGNSLTVVAGVVAEVGENLVIKLGDNAGANKLSFTDSDGAEIASLDSNGNLSILNEMRIYDPTGVEYGKLYRDLNYFYISKGTGGVETRIDGIYRFTATKFGVTADSTYSIGESALRFADGFIDDIYTDGLHIQDPTHAKTHDITATLTSLDIAAEEVLGTAMAINLNIPVGAGGAANAALDMQQKIDGTLEAGLLAETDGAGSYQDPVFKIPYMTGDYEADWSTFTPPAPASLTNGCEVTVWNTNGAGAGRRYSYVNGGWKYVALT